MLILRILENEANYQNNVIKHSNPLTHGHALFGSVKQNITK